MKAKHEIINKIIKDNNYENYLEIGFGTGHNFNKIDCLKKDAVDPNTTSKQAIKMTSDELFAQNEKLYSCVFVDGLHHADQVRKDIINAMKCLRENGCIILHDTIPHTEAMQEVPRKQTQWTGDCWRAAVGFIQSYPDVKVETYRSDYGLTVIYPEGKKVRKHFENMEMTYKDFKDNEVDLLKIID